MHSFVHWFIRSCSTEKQYSGFGPTWARERINNKNLWHWQIHKRAAEAADWVCVCRGTSVGVCLCSWLHSVVCLSKKTPQGENLYRSPWCVKDVSWVCSGGLATYFSSPKYFCTASNSSTSARMWLSYALRATAVLLQILYTSFSIQCTMLYIHIYR